jgi:pimeloyl-ACP methyl ester carboxylesterase
MKKTKLHQETNLRAFAVYSKDDKSLRFYKREEIPVEGSLFEEKKATFVYTGVESLEAQHQSELPWFPWVEEIESVKFVDEIVPISTAYWFSEMESCREMYLAKLNTSKVTDMVTMFSWCKNLTSLGIHLQHKNEVLKKKKRCLTIRILKWIGAAVGIVLALTFILVFGCRNINYLKHYQMVETGVDEGIYVSLGGMEQYVLVRSMDTDNPVIIYLHGGPSSPDTYATYSFSDDLVDEYTVIAWDQRGCGRTYFHNINTDPENTSVSFEQAKEDLDELVDYARERFGKEKVIILGHSYGTILGSEYALEHPDKVSAYIAAAQVLSLEETDIYSYEDALQKAIEAGDDTSDMIKAFEQFQKSGLLIDQLRLRSLVSVYHSVDVSDKEAWMAITSPYFGVDDFRWFFKQLDDLEDYISLNQQLFDYTMAFDVYNNGLTYEMPVYFISGSCDWICPVDSVKEYSEAITAPEVRLELVEGCGHGVQYSDSEEFANIVRELLDRIK